MSVLDASLLTDALVVGRPNGEAARVRLATRRIWHAPQLLPVEVLSAIRGLLLGGHIDAAVASVAQERLARTRVRLHPFAPFHERIWQLRANATAYDAWYLALAERLDAPLVTTDPKLAKVPGARCAVEVVS